MRNKVAFIIPYYGHIPDYFDLWAQSAGANRDYDFFVVSDLPFDTQGYENIKLIEMGFQELKIRIQKLMDFKITLDTPYKLCEYKPVYGHVFEEYIREYDFWGFCDVDVILGNLNHFITDKMLDDYDKLWFSGHFTLMRNNEKMKRLYREKYPNVQDYRFAYTIKHVCHFDENGTIAYADEYEPDIRFYFRWSFFDTNVYSYELLIRDTESCVVWDNGTLTAYWNEGMDSEEFMYIHLQKRKMLRKFSGKKDTFAIMRNEFLEIDSGDIVGLLHRPVNQQLKREFEENARKRQEKHLWKRFFQGWPKYKFFAVIRKWRTVKKLCHMPRPEIQSEEYH